LHRRIIGTVLTMSLALLVVSVGAGSADAATITWKAKGTAYSKGLNSLDCPTAKLCVGAGYDAVAVSTNPTGPAKDWKKFYIDRTTGPDGNPNDLTSVACVSVSACVTGDSSNNGWLATKPDSGGWTPFAFPSETYVTIEGIGCSHLGNCTALGVDGREMSTPKLGAGQFSFVSLPHTNPNETNSSAPAQISCPNQTCVIAWAAGGVWVGQSSTNKFSWVPIKHADEIESVDCPTASFCIAGSDDGSGAGTWISHNPSSSGSWKPVALKSKPSAVACPSTRLCLAAAGANTYSSTNPTVASSWKPDGGQAFKGIGSELSCPTAGLCVDSDQFGGISVARF
jgi:hypothetical protein